MSAGPTIEVTRAGPVAILALTAEATRNALSVAMQRDMLAALDLLAADESVGALILTGRGKSFCSGADLGGLVAERGETLGETVARLMDEVTHKLILRLRDFEVPVIAAVNGAAAGAGASLALACDIVVAAENAAFLFPFAPKLGLIPDCGATWHLARRVGPARALSLALTGERLSAVEAARIGLIAEAVADATLHERALALATAAAAAPPGVAGELRRAFDAALAQEFADQLDYERARQRLLLDSDAFAEGKQAFLEKRAPTFPGRAGS